MREFVNQSKNLLSYITERFYETEAAEVFCAFALLLCILMFIKSYLINCVQAYCECVEYWANCCICKFLGLDDVEIEEETSKNFY